MPRRDAALHLVRLYTRLLKNIELIAVNILIYFGRNLGNYDHPPPVSAALCSIAVTKGEHWQKWEISSDSTYLAW